MEYTKGEWKVWIHPDRIPPEGEGTWAIYIADEQSKAIAKVSNEDTNIMKANANLIASAPDLYEALKELATYRNAWKDVLGDKLTEMLTKALAKAEGK